jgi:glucose-6-phosphate dehydrogenase assembly protein OpcA
MIVDSARDGAPAFADMRVLSNAGYLVADLAWTRLTKLRQLLARLLEGRNLNGIRAVAIEYGGTHATPEVRYLHAWLRTALPAATVDLRRIPAGGVPGLAAIRIDAGVTVRLKENCAEYEAGPLRQHATLPEGSEHELLAEELNIVGRDSVFERALQRMTAWTPRS